MRPELNPKVRGVGPGAAGKGLVRKGTCGVHSEAAEQRRVSARVRRVPAKGQEVSPRVGLRQGEGVPSAAPCSSLYRGPVCVSACPILRLNQAPFVGCHS